MTKTEDEEAFENVPAFQQLRINFERGLGQRRNAFREALEKSDYAHLSALAHQLRGCGGLYGHQKLSDICASIEAAAAIKDEELPSMVEELGKYISNTL